MAEIAVLIPHYNALNPLKKSIMSIDEEIDVDIFIIDDGSLTKPIEDDFKRYKHGRVFIYGYEKNKGIEHALNLGLKEIQNKKYSYIGRLDCADTCLKNRFTKQIAFFEENETLFMLGTWVNLRNEEGAFLYKLEPPTQHEEIKKKSFINAMFIHPSVCFRSSILDSVGFYPTTYPAAEDYAFFFDIIQKHETANYPEILVNVEVNSHGISATKRKVQVKSRIKVVLKHFYFGFFPIYGLIRNILLLFMPRELITMLKRIFYK